ncbi:MAG: MurR/RpiR family transcriptional regulator [Acidimicrobiia bacterium]
MNPSHRIEGKRGSLTPAESRVARIVLIDPEAIAFGSVAALARRAGASGATVVRLADKLGYAGFVGLQAAVRTEIARQLRPAVERIRQPGAADLLARAAAVETDNVTATLGEVDPGSLDDAAKLMADRRRRLLIVSGDATAGVARTLADGLAMLRPGVELLDGSEVRMLRAVTAASGDVLLVVDVVRYDRALLTVARAGAGGGARLVTLSDSPLSPIALLAEIAFTVRAVGVGPFDSHVGTLALANALVAAVARRLRRSATERLDGIEAAWQKAGALSED